MLDDWTESGSPFHPGEQEVQERMGVRDIEDWARKVVRPAMPKGHREFHTALPFLVAAARDGRGRPRVTLLTGPEGFITSPDAKSLAIGAAPVAGDAWPARYRPGLISDCSALSSLAAGATASMAVSNPPTAANWYFLSTKRSETAHNIFASGNGGAWAIIRPAFPFVVTVSRHHRALGSRRPTPSLSPAVTRARAKARHSAWMRRIAAANPASSRL